MSKLFIKGFKTGTKMFSNNISTIVNAVLLTLVYLVGVGATSIFAKITGKKFLQTRLSKEKETYWSDMDLKKKPMEEYYRQF